MNNKIGKFEINRIYCGDSLELMKDIPDKSIDLVLTDPPFAIKFKGRRNNYHRRADRVLQGYNEIPQEKYKDFSLKWIKETYRILKETGSAYIFSGWNNLKDILIAIDDAGYHTLNHLIWKYQFGVFTKKKFVTSHYHILLVVKNLKKYKFNKIDHYPEDVIMVKRDYWHGKMKTETKLPVELVKKLILYSSDEGDIVFDPFMGSGTTAEACRLTNRNYLGFEIVPEYVDFANDRISKIPPPLEKWEK
ncbi:site-specific DNA-methyltransferase [Methanophagales archaeon]|nr:MAG: site-specific DNA-methyltransferase [Methanophagales archaeon]